MARILVVDDSSIMRRNLIAILRRAGHEIVAEAANGELGYKEYEKYKPDIVTMDITMPVMDGIAAVKKIIQAFPNANIIMISALDQKFMVLTAIQCGAKHYIIKPFTPEKVVQVINEVLKIAEKAPVASNNPSINMNGPIGKINNAIDDISKTLNALDESKKNEKADDSNQLPFSIENKNSILMINISKNIQTSHFDSLTMVVQGFLFVKPLRVVLNFGSLTSLDDSLFDKVAEIIKPIRNADGQVKIAAQNEEFLTHASSKNLDAATIRYESADELYEW